MTTQTPRRTALQVALPLLLLAISTSGCSTRSRRIEIIDLDKVLDVFSETLKSPIDGNTPADASPGASQTTLAPGSEVTALGADQEKPELTEKFLTQFGTALNNAKLMSTPIWARMDGNGSILGYSDYDGSRTKGGSDRDLFRIEIDPDSGRIIATDMQRSNYRRDHHYHGYHHGYGYHGGGGFFMGYMLGSMRGRSNRYYDEPTRRRPNFGTMNMAPKGYHTSALQSAKTQARTRARSRSSARSSGGSRSFRSGK
ncbi:MAG: hypothetical protein AB8H80_21555 [Planctomycetota bacterium]